MTLDGHPRRGRARHLATAGALLIGALRPAAAQTCTVTSSQVSLERFSGARIDSVRIDARSLRETRVLGLTLPRMHARTRTSTIERELLFAPGDTVDTLRVAESLRRLRALGYLDEVAIEGRRCGPGSGVVLVVHSRDRWSTSAKLRVRSSSTGLLLREENLAGTGRAMRLGVEVDRTGLAATASMRDPALFGTLWGQLGVARYGNGSQWSGAVGTRRRGLEDTWIAELQGMTSEREPRSRLGSVFQRTATSLVVGRRVTPAGAPSMLALTVGAETDRADLSAARTDALVGPASVTRSYAGVTGGLVLRAARFDTLSWLLPRGALVDVPRGLESEVVLGVGRDGRAGRGAAHLDAWLGRVWHPSPRSLVLGDLWGSGYAGSDLLGASTIRASLTAVRAEATGAWIARVGGERLIQPDPDVRALSTTDPTASLLPSETRLSESALAGSLERRFPLRSIGPSLALDGALFGAASYRWDPATTVAAPGGAALGVGPERESIGIATLGLGLRVLPLRHAGTTLRLDLGVPVVGPPRVGHRPYVALTFTPWYLGDRHRDGRGGW